MAALPDTGLMDSEPRQHGSSAPAETEEYVVLCGPDGTAIGQQSKRTVHHQDTPLHLAFSCYLFDTEGRFLVSWRARHKRTWPGVRTNSCCGHPAPGEELAPAVARRLGQELGVVPDRLELVLPGFAYRAVMDDGVVENELCPVFRAVTADPDSVRADPEEVDLVRWEDWTAFADQATADPDSVSPWCAQQVAQLRELGPDPLGWAVGDAARLPAAARG